MFATVFWEQEQGLGVLLLDAGLVSIFLMISGTGFALSRTALRSWSSSAVAASKLLEREEDKCDKPEDKCMKERPGQLERPEMPPLQEAEAPSPSTDADSVSDDKVSATPNTDEASTPDAKELARALARESRVAAAAQAAAVAAAAVFIEALSMEQKSLHAQVRAIAREAFSDAALQSHKGEKVAALVLGEEVVGYASYILRPQLGSMNVNKLAVSSARRRQGLGRCLLRHLIQLAKRPTMKSGRGGGKGQTSLEVLCLSSLPTAISFYKACGFKEEPDVKLPEDEEELEEGQVYMEYRLRRRRAK